MLLYVVCWNVGSVYLRGRWRVWGSVMSLALGSRAHISLSFNNLISNKRHYFGHLSSLLLTRVGACINWLTHHCTTVVAGVLPFLIHASIVLHSGVVPVLLQLLQCALCGSRVLPPTPSGGLSPSKAKRDRERKEEGRSLAQGHSAQLKCKLL